MSYNPFTLKNKTILITGASSGIGRATAIECSKLGAKVIITARNEERLAETFDTLEKYGGGVNKMVVADANDISSVETIVSQVEKIDGLVNNAGISKNLPVKFITEEKLEETLRVNLKFPILLTAKLLKQKKLSKGGSVVFTSSVGGALIGEPGLGIYASSKGGIYGFVKAALTEVDVQNIRMNAVLPGMIDTNIFDGTVSDEDIAKYISTKIPMCRTGKPEEVSSTVVYLLSDASKFVNGANLVVDGGMTIV